MKKIAGISASRGISIGPVFQFKRQKLEIEETVSTDPVEEMERLQAALNSAKDQIDDIYQKALMESSDADAEIFQAHRMILDDPELLSSVKEKINSGRKSAESAMQEGFLTLPR